MARNPIWPTFSKPYKTKVSKMVGVITDNYDMGRISNRLGGPQTACLEKRKRTSIERH